MISDDDPAIGRFDRSFLIHMIRDFFLILLVVTVLEFALKATMVYVNYAKNGTDEAQVVADELAENVKSVMRNEGGPVAARTMYPILDQNWTDLGYYIAIEPSPRTIEAIQEGFDFTPEGITRETWPEGAYKAASIDIKAEAFCLQCHTKANVGDVLGTVTVRNYLSRDFALWFDEVMVGAGLAVGKIVLHSVLLFLILRARMAPLMELRAVVSNLARAYGGLKHRADVRTHDEFGALARDLNLFLDRINRVVGELGQVLGKVVSVNDDIVATQSELKDQINTIVSMTRSTERAAMLAAKREPRLSNEWFEATRALLESFDETVKGAQSNSVSCEVLKELHHVVENAEAQLKSSEAVFDGLANVGDKAHQLGVSMAEMTRLEERLQAIIESGNSLVCKLQPDTDRIPPTQS